MGVFYIEVEVDNGVSDDMICTFYIVICICQLALKSYQLKSTLLDGFAPMCLLFSSFFWGRHIHSHGYCDHLCSLFYSQIYTSISLFWLRLLSNWWLDTVIFSFTKSLSLFQLPAGWSKIALTISWDFPTATIDLSHHLLLPFLGWHASCSS